MINLGANKLFLGLFLAIPMLAFSQEGKITVRQNPIIDSLMAIKIENDRAIYNNQYYTIQLYYGNYAKAQEKMTLFKGSFPQIEVNLSFETPNYKVQAGKYKDRLQAEQELDTIKNSFPTAFLLTKK